MAVCSMLACSLACVHACNWIIIILYVRVHLLLTTYDLNSPLRLFFIFTTLEHMSVISRRDIHLFSNGQPQRQPCSCNPGFCLSSFRTISDRQWYHHRPRSPKFPYPTPCPPYLHCCYYYYYCPSSGVMLCKSHTRYKTEKKET